MGSTAQLLIIGLIFHVVFIRSVFDCYFTSPVVHGMASFNAEIKAAKRLVLIVGDGLRADLLFHPNGFAPYPDAPDVVAPYLRSIVETRGAWGISHTRVPTESRPGHVAIIGGMYEDVSAVAKGWKTNPVDFDSVFNQSSHTYSFGSPDILPMFTRGAVPGRVKEWSYDEDAEDFTQDATNLDFWVADQLETLLKNATTDATLDGDLRADKVVIFLHLLGLDTTGHSYRPHSPEYMRNIQAVDSIVQRTERMISEFYGDEQTAYVFTADHGMSVIGNHGDGHPDNTRTPLVAWGKGVRGPLEDTTPTSHDDYSAPWGLNHLYRRDVEQADITALMAALIGADWPVNSVGVLPDVDPTRPGYLDSSEDAIAKTSLVNAKVILEHYRIQHETKLAHKLWYHSFAPLEGSVDSPRRVGALLRISNAIVRKEYASAREQSLSLIKDGLEGLRYLQTYERTLLRTVASLAYSGWSAYTSLFVFKNNLTPSTSSISTLMGVTALTILIGLWTIFFIEHAPITYHLYVVFPVYFWQQFFSKGWQWFHPSYLRRIVSRKPLLTILLVGGSLGSMVVAYTHRSIWSIGFVVIGLVWPILGWTKDERERVGRQTMAMWMFCCSVSAVFPLLSVEKTESLLLILLGGALLFLSAGYALYQTNRTMSKPLQRVLAAQFVVVVLTMVITASSVRNLQAKNGLPFLNQVAGWVVFVIGTAVPFISTVKHQTPQTKMISVLLGLAPCFILLSISVEGLFLAAYAMTLLVWVDVETNLRAPRHIPTSSAQTPGKALQYTFQPADLRIVLFFLFFVQVGFFGTGNVASVSSFYLSPVYRLIPVFNPFYMSALLVFKIVSPYLILALAFATITRNLHMPPFALFLNALMLTDGMTLVFFFNVTDTGSWLEIGQTISFFIVTSLLALFSGGICTVGEFMLSGVDEQRGKIHVE
ncbi:PigN-domain-containing protein [Cylindrobasidium torrendii FP15055 ss-10]|uniref:GPI ethanolamine phosphate transferase 1 n=1 Tax=Cylindrobasidium torrendii FP15055 ss-10 TaxID=1314674 RepID=A0A0D7B6S5_9AGAR|nr:PigN-domain-containing protein [Cylindrobasidium torrendii FP15055 ss-10]